jgi:regulator of sigma E protease
MLDSLIGWLFRAAVVTGAFGLLILVHEAGHFVVARLSGVRILKFSIGFGPTLVAWRGKETEYCVAWFPLGGFVKMAGEQQQDSTEQPWEYSSKPAGVRALIVLAGPLVNYATAVLLLWVFLLRGYTGLLPVVGNVMEDMPAKASGLMVGDEIQSVGREAVRTWDEMTMIIHKSANEPLTLGIRRGAKQLSIEVTPKPEEVELRSGGMETIGLVGIGAGSRLLGPVEAFAVSIRIQNHWAVQTIKALGSLLAGKRKIKDSMTGPLGIVYLTSEAASLGAGPLLILLSLFSLSLAIFNCFPVPILDGGHLLFLALEKLRGRPVSIVVQERAAMVGLVLLVTLALVVSVNDIQRFWFQKQ